MPSIPLGQIELALHVGHHTRNPPQILKVVKYTATQVVCAHEGTNSELRFRLADGYRVGGGLTQRVEPVTAETHELVRWHRADNQVRNAAYAIEEMARKLAHKERRALPSSAVRRQLAALMSMKLGLEEFLKDEPSKGDG